MPALALTSLVPACGSAGAPATADGGSGADSSTSTTAGSGATGSAEATTTATDSGSAASEGSSADAGSSGSGESGTDPEPTAPPCDTTIAADLVAAVGDATDGAVICLESGTYPGAGFDAVVKTSDVTIRPADGADVTIEGMSLDASAHLRFTGLGGSMRIAGIDVDPVEGNPASIAMTFDHIDFTEAITLRARAADMGWLIDHCRFEHIAAALYEGRITVRGYDLDADQGIVISNNLFRGGGEQHSSDGVQLIGGANGVIVRDNEFTQLDQGDYPEHVDPIQVYGARNIVVTGNYFHDNDGTGGFVDFDGPNPGMVVTNNVFVAHEGEFYPWSVAANAAQGWLIQHNTFVGGGSVRIDGAAMDNVVRDNLWIGGGGLSVEEGLDVEHDHNLNSGWPGDGEIVGEPTFVGGPMPASFDGFALAPGSIGTGASSTGGDIGIMP